MINRMPAECTQEVGNNAGTLLASFSRPPRRCVRLKMELLSARCFPAERSATRSDSSWLRPPLLDPACSPTCSDWCLQPASISGERRRGRGGGGGEEKGLSPTALLAVSVGGNKVRRQSTTLLSGRKTSRRSPGVVTFEPGESERERGSRGRVGGGG